MTSKHSSSSSRSLVSLSVRWGAPLLLACSLVTAPAWSSSRDDHEQALQAVQSGQVLPLTTVLERLAAQHPGQVLEVELEREAQQWIYEIKLLTTDGQLVKLKLDAGTAQVLRMKVREPKPAIFPSPRTTP
ncbi:MAG: PepSY domain-containing protein [Giesbergeria sp.]|nr:PepSY domain-containing protein [Giesbergeria sp.]